VSIKIILYFIIQFCGFFIVLFSHEFLGFITSAIYNMYCALDVVRIIIIIYLFQSLYRTVPGVGMYFCTLHTMKSLLK